MDINKANHEELMQAFQVDGQRAEYILRKRDELGGFKSWDEDLGDERNQRLVASIDQMLNELARERRQLELEAPRPGHPRAARRCLRAAWLARS